MSTPSSSMVILHHYSSTSFKKKTLFFWSSWLSPIFFHIYASRCYSHFKNLKSGIVFLPHSQGFPLSVSDVCSNMAPQVSVPSMIVSSVLFIHPTLQLQAYNSFNSSRNLKPPSLSQTIFPPYSLYHSIRTFYSHSHFYSSTVPIHFHKHHSHCGFSCLSASLDTMAYDFNSAFVITLLLLPS